MCVLLKTNFNFPNAAASQFERQILTTALYDCVYVGKIIGKATALLTGPPSYVA